LQNRVRVLELYDYSKLSLLFLCHFFGSSLA